MPYYVPHLRDVGIAHAKAAKVGKGGRDVLFCSAFAGRAYARMFNFKLFVVVS